MPIVTVKLDKERTLETKRRLVAGLTDFVVETLDVRREQVTVLIEVLGPANWASGGELRNDRGTQDQDVPARQDIDAIFRKPSVAVKAKPKKAATKSPRRR